MWTLDNISELWTIDAADHYLKPFVIQKPEVIVSRRTSTDEFLILATDGLWVVVSNNFVCQVVRRCLDGRMKRRKLNENKFSEGVNESHVADAAVVLTELAMARGSKDNISVVVMELNNSGKCKVWWEWYICISIFIHYMYVALYSFFLSFFHPFVRAFLNFEH